VQASDIAAVVLTHAHIDHSGYLPLLVRQGFRGAIFCGAATRDLCRILLPDSGGLQEEEADYANRHGFSKHAPALPLYTREDALTALQQFEAVPWHQDWQAAPGLRASLHHAGHMAGAAQVRLAGGGTSILFSGDVGRPDDLVLRGPEAPPPADFLVLESTYGDRLHPRVDVLDQLAAIVRRTAARGGTLVIPAFAVGRAQTLLHALHLLQSQQRIPALPVFLDSPMAAEALKVFGRHPLELRLSPEEIAGMAGAAHIVQTPAQSGELEAKRGPMIIIAGSGMATGGRVVHHLKAFAPERRNTILLVGFQASGTRGASLRAGAASLRIHGEDVPVRAEVAIIDALSGHADAGEIASWLQGASVAPACTFITHGEPAAADALRQRIERTLGWRVQVPDYLETVALQRATAGRA
jgi:metallo-beta-lactamase family protein